MMTYSEMKNSVLKSMNKWDYDVMCFIHTFLVGLPLEFTVNLFSLKALC